MTSVKKIGDSQALVWCRVQQKVMESKVSVWFLDLQSDWSFEFWDYLCMYLLLLSRFWERTSFDWIRWVQTSQLLSSGNIKLTSSFLDLTAPSRYEPMFAGTRWLWVGAFGEADHSFWPSVYYIHFPLQRDLMIFLIRAYMNLKGVSSATEGEETGKTKWKPYGPPLLQFLWELRFWPHGTDYAPQLVTWMCSGVRVRGLCAGWNSLDSTYGHLNYPEGKMSKIVELGTSYISFRHAGLFLLT